MNGATRTSEISISALDFFAGSGLVRLGLETSFRPVWANDICAKKAAIYVANFPSDPFLLSDICDVNGSEVPAADLAWASFPCQDLSLAGAMSGMKRGHGPACFGNGSSAGRTHRKWQAAVPYFVPRMSSDFLARRGDAFQGSLSGVERRGYLAGAVVLDASWFLPQSRPRAF